MTNGNNQNRLEELLRAFAVHHLEDRDMHGDAAREALSLLDPPEDLFGSVDADPYNFNVVGIDEVRLKGALTRCTRCRSLFNLQLRRMGDGTVRNQPQCPGCRTLGSQGRTA